VTFVEVIETVGEAIDASGVAVIVGGALLAVALTVTRRRQPQGTSYELLRRQLGRSILLGLEFLVAADAWRSALDIKRAAAFGRVRSSRIDCRGNSPVPCDRGVTMCPSA
jgi:uncharacterized membrane protein